MRAFLVLFAILMSFVVASPALAQDEAKAKAELAKIEKAYKAAKTAFEKKPKDAAVKKTYVASTVKFGTATMLSPALGPRQKYAGALKLYREALKVDPKNKEALNNKKMIEDIYTQMGRPIPKD